MRKFTLLVVAALLSTAVSAQKMARNAMPQRTSLRTALTEKPDMNRMGFGLPDGMKVANLSKSRLAKAAEGMKKARRAAGAADFDIITEKPAGNEVVYSRSGLAYYLFYGYVFGAGFDEAVGRVIYGEDNTVYLYNPLSQLYTKSYMKGTIDENGVVTVSLPQPIYSGVGYEGETLLYNIDRLKFVDDEDGGWYYQDEDSREIKYVLRNDSLLWAEDESGDVLLGLTDAETNEWFGYADWATTFTPHTDVPVALPANLTSEKWVLTYGDDDGRYVNVAFSGNDVYLGNICKEFPDSWIKGELAGNKVTFGTNQYLGPDDASGFHTYMVTAGMTQVYDEENNAWIPEPVATEKIELTYDAANKVMKAETKNDSTMLINSGKKSMYYLYAYDAPVFKYQKPIAGAVKPKTPVMVDFMPHNDYYGYGYIQFDLPKVDVDGNFIAPENMHYNLIVDDELFAFYADEYVGITEDGMVDVPYSYTDDFDIINDGSVTHTIYFYFVSADKIGVQTTYTGDNGESMKSDIAWLDINAVGIDNAKAVEAGVTGVRYTDLAGRTVSGKEKGLYIKTVTYADGTVRSTKMVRK